MRKETAALWSFHGSQIITSPIANNFYAPIQIHRKSVQVPGTMSLTTRKQVF